MLDPFTNKPPVPQPIAYRLREAAKVLGIGERLLWDLAKRGEIKTARFGRAVLFPLSELERLLAERCGLGNGGAE